MKFYLFLLITSFHVFNGLAQEWKLKKDKNGIKVYTRTLDSTKIHEYKAVMIIDIPIEKVYETITDGDNIWIWNYRTSASKVLKKYADGEFILWMSNNLPWPIRDRDHISLVKTITNNKGEVRIDILPKPSYNFPAKKGVIRITNFKGYWLIVPKPEGVEVTQQMYGDPEGALAPWLVNTMLSNGAYHSFFNLKQLLEN
ncbi:START domain-containing protein [Leptobacterium sp. I13]|uniref:START domain-containing protein n=1 Tax=Leptobacterium meishanense TaxID=3128904 RepID=UPI0030EF990B